MRERPFLCMGLASFLSVLLCAVLPTTGVIVVMTALLLLTATFFVFHARSDAKTAMAACLGALVLCGGFLLKTCLVVYPTLSYADNAAYVTMRVTETVAIGERYIVETTKGDLPAGVRLCLWTHDAISPRAGDYLTAEVTLIAAFDKSDENGAAAKANGVYLYAFLTDETPLVWEDGGEQLSVLERVLYALRDGIHDTLYRRLSFDDAALCESMLLGDHENLSVTAKNNFRVSGVYHLLVVSGLHLTLIVGVVMRLLALGRVPRAVQIGLSMTATLLFAALCGFTASVTRAAVMIAVMLLAQAVHRGADGLNSLGLTAVLMLLFDPFCIYDIGWQLSFAATLGILAVLPVWEKEITGRVPVPWCRPIVSAVGAAVCATLMTQPLTALYFGELSLVFALGNLLCVSVSSLLLIACAVSFAAGWIPYVGEAVYAFIHGICAFLNEVTAWLADVPFASLTVREPFAIVWLFALVILVCAAYALYKGRGVLQVTALLSSVLFVCVSVFAVAQADVKTVSVMPTAAAAFAVDTADSCGLVFEGDGDDLAVAAEELTAAGIRRLDWLLWLVEPSVQTVDLSSLTVSVEHLVTVADASEYVSLPPSERCSTLLSGQTLTFSESASLARDGDAYYLRIGEAKLLVCPKSVTEMTLAEEWYTADAVLLRELVPTNVSEISADTLVVFAKRGRESFYKQLLSHRFETVHFAASDGALQLQTRGHGDISLHNG